jgi:hypothetical protein
MTVIARLREDAAITARSYAAQAQRGVKRAMGRSPVDMFLRERPSAEVEEDAVGTGLAGDEIVRRIHENITVHMGSKMKMRRSQFQAQVHVRIINTLLHLIYAKDWEQHRDRILRHYGIKRYKMFVLCTAPRREGKTWMLAMLVAAILDLVVMRIVVFSIAKRVSKWFMDAVMDFYRCLPGSQTRVATSNQENFVVSPSGQVNDAAASTLICLPNSERSRGITAQLVIFEECAFLGDNLIKNIGAPLFRMTNCSVAAITSPGTDQNNFMARLMETERSNPHSIYDFIAQELLCTACSDARKVECNHKVVDRPAWISLDKEAEQKSMYGTDTVRYQREMMGMSVTEDIMAFPHEQVKQLFQKPRYQWRVGSQKPGWVFHCIDPGGGGEQSDTAWVSIAFDELGQAVVSSRY